MATKAEQETAIRFDEAEKLVHVWSASPTVWRRLERQGFTVREETRHKGELTGRFYVAFPRAEFRFGKKRASRMSEEQRAAARERILKLRRPDEKTGSDELAGEP